MKQYIFIVMALLKFMTNSSYNVVDYELDNVIHGLLNSKIVWLESISYMLVTRNKMIVHGQMIY